MTDTKRHRAGRKRIDGVLPRERILAEPRARAMFLDVRAEAYSVLTQGIGKLAPGLTIAQIHLLATFALAGADGLFIARQIGEDSVDLPALFELHTRAVYYMAAHMMAESAA